MQPTSVKQHDDPAVSLPQVVYGPHDLPICGTSSPSSRLRMVIVRAVYSDWMHTITTASDYRHKRRASAVIVNKVPLLQRAAIAPIDQEMATSVYRSIIAEYSSNARIPE